MVFDATADLNKFDEALSFFLARAVITRDELGPLTRDSHQRAFTLANVAQASVVQDVFDEIAKAIEFGEPFEDFRGRVAGKLEKAWSPRPREGTSARLETIFRNATQASYNRGRFVQMKDPVIAELRPIWLYDAILDSRTSAICNDLNGTRLPHDDPWWRTHYPPVHHRCRSGVRALRTEQNDRMGGTTFEPPATPADPGFGATPDESFEFRPDPSRFDGGLFTTLIEKIRAFGSR